MDKFFCGNSGTNEKINGKNLSELPVEEFLKLAFINFFGDDIDLRPAQDLAISQYKILESKENIILSTPTNSGKSLLCYLMALREAIQGKRAIIVEPLRVLAQEKAEELEQICSLIKLHGGPKIRIVLTTGDYRISDDFMEDCPSEGSKTRNKFSGEIVVATPERLDAISRIVEYMVWFERVSIVCIDEAHLIGDHHRGATLELLITFLRTIESNLQIILLSATISNCEELAEWLQPCQVINNVPRYPSLEKWLYRIDEGEEVNAVLTKEVQRVLEKDDTSILIFVYRTSWAEGLANLIAEQRGNKKRGNLKATIEYGVAWYHAGMSSSSRMLVKKALLKGDIRVVVSTTALAWGINLPTTHVYIRDITFPGVKELDTGELIQMMGRAGRGDRPGVGTIFHRKTDKIDYNELETRLCNESYPRLVSQLSPPEQEGYYCSRRDDNRYLGRLANQILGVLHRMGPSDQKDIENFLSSSWGGKHLVSELDALLKNLCRWKLAYLSETNGKYELTSLGKTAARYYLPSNTAANMGQLIRDLLQDDPSGSHLRELKMIDILIILSLTSDEMKSISRYSKALEDQVTLYMESLPISEKSYLYRRWIAGDAVALLGSARIDNKFTDIEAKKLVYQCTHRAMLLYDLSKGISFSNLEARYHVKVEELEEKLRDNALWLLHALENILGVRNFYYHLRAICEIEPEDIQPIDRSFKMLSRQIFALLANLRFRSTLGELIRGIKRVYPNANRYPGEGTIRKLEENGISGLGDLVKRNSNDLVKMGIERRYADLIVGYILKRRS
ncbi:DEAD/DEAH box helicase [Desulfosporosinus fructosivorans]|uniref:DEAD/DEAH box helicase n=1 Tax=Desulfosporosinus fructosivorans TaxID=2018669 RepID=A0A4Z0R4C8_9FIRM|nr:DEAD/DEAH box helicase [Desulfosporosinus fructosivorans]TGE37195.1 DEAD/DEAH box helicase [Desulfosporosinus fructosivorans]